MINKYVPSFKMKVRKKLVNNLRKPYILFIFLFSITQVQAMQMDIDDVYNKVSMNIRSSAGPYFSLLPSEQLIEIGQYLHGTDFQNLVITCKYIRGSLNLAPELFMPADDEVVSSAIKNAPLESITTLGITWTRSPRKRAILSLRKVLNLYQAYKPDESTTNFTIYGEAYNNYLKTLNLLHIIGDQTARKEYEKFYYELQKSFHSTIKVIDLDTEEIPNPVKHEFYSEIFALVNPSVRKRLAEAYAEGTDVFEKNEAKRKKYSHPISLPLFH